MPVSEISTEPQKVQADLIALSFFEDERPLRGIAGLVDWRMNGYLSKLVLDGTISGREGEIFMTTTDGRLASPRLLLYGLGDSRSFDAERFKKLLAGFMETIVKLHPGTVVATVPGSSVFSSTSALDAVRATASSSLPSAEVLIFKD